MPSATSTSFVQVAARYRVLLFAMLESPDEARHVAKLAPFCERVEWAVMRAGSEVERARDFLGHLLQGRPLVTWPYASRSLEIKLRDLVSTGTVHILRSSIPFWRTSAMRFPRARAVGRSSRSTTSARTQYAPCCTCNRVRWRSWVCWSRRSYARLGGPTCAAFRPVSGGFRNRGPAPVRGGGRHRGVAHPQRRGYRGFAFRCPRPPPASA